MLSHEIIALELDCWPVVHHDDVNRVHTRYKYTIRAVEELCIHYSKPPFLPSPCPVATVVPCWGHQSWDKKQ